MSEKKVKFEKSDKPYKKYKVTFTDPDTKRDKRFTLEIVVMNSFTVHH